MKSFLQFLLFVLAITLALAGLYAWKSGHLEVGAPAGTGPSSPHALPSVQPALNASRVPGLAALDDEFGRLAEAVIPSVVSITSRRGSPVDPREELLRRYLGLGGPPQPETSPVGSGAIVSAEGHIVTNLHVVEGAREISVTLSDGRRLPGRILGVDPLSDIAILKIDAEGLQPLAFGDSEKVRVGQMVFAVGAPYGLQESVTMGIISARDRLISSETVNEFFQTDAPINPGNSGGPLVNVRGEIVGLNNRIKTESGGSQGVAFAIPSNTVRRVLDKILTLGRVPRPYLGLVMAPFDEAIAQQLGLPDANGALVEAVLQGSPADEAGIRPGDVIRQFDGRDIRDFNELRKRVSEAAVDSKVTLQLIREGQTLEVPAQIVEQQRPGRTMLAPPPGVGAVVPQPMPAPPAGGNALAGVAVEAVNPGLVQRYRLPSNVEGVIVEAIAPGSPADGILRPGDAIEQVNDMTVTSPADFARAVEELPRGGRAILLLARGPRRSFEVIGP
ncbi:MAG: trypsin-like peptidase domain-containing protein [Chthoniobacterales bacterium]|jgi:Do/DeqQ family serine protease